MSLSIPAPRRGPARTNHALPIRVAAIVALLILPGRAACGGISLEHAWAQPSPPKATAGRAYVTIVNNSPEVEHLVGVTTEAARSAEISGIRILQDVPNIRQLFNLDISPGHSIEFTPGGFHILLRNLKKPLRPGETFAGELIFEKAGAIPVTFQVEPSGKP